MRLSPLVDGDGRPTGRSSASAARRAGSVVVLASLLWGLGAAAQVDHFAALRHNMVDDQVRKHGIEEPSVLQAFETVPKHLFVPERYQTRAYDGVPVAYSPGQYLPHPYVSARMISLLELDAGDKVLEIGTGSGYEAALLSQVAGQVYTIEIDRTLGGQARKTLRRLGYDNVEVRIGDGYRGWPEEAPFDAILVTASAPSLPAPLYEQLKEGGKIVLAVGNLVQEMQLITRTPEGPSIRKISLVNLEPMTGEVRETPPP